MTQAPNLITQENFANALVDGIAIPAGSDNELFDFGNRLIDWINLTDNLYWACWNPEEKNNIIIDIRNTEVINLRLLPNRIIFLKPENGAAEDLPREFGNGAVGILLFCMIENGEIEELALDEIHKKEKVTTIPDTEKEESPDFEWI
tara:strand:+ start:362 stop:802 length:441 start_codon:yes stop_codon:yes gene_type:complete